MRYSESAVALMVASARADAIAGALATPENKRAAVKAQRAARRAMLAELQSVQHELASVARVPAGEFLKQETTAARRWTAQTNAK